MVATQQGEEFFQPLGLEVVQRRHTHLERGKSDDLLLKAVVIGGVGSFCYFAALMAETIILILSGWED